MPRKTKGQAIKEGRRIVKCGIGVMINGFKKK